MDHTRHIDIYDVSKEVVTLIGAGGIVATTAIALAKMGICGLVVYDMDSVGTENLATQLHRLSDVGKTKVDAISEAISTYSNDDRVPARNASPRKPSSRPGSLSAQWTISPPAEVWRSVHYPMGPLLIDARMSAEEFHLYTVDLKSEDSVKRYNDMIWQESDENVPRVGLHDEIDDVLFIPLGCLDWSCGKNTHNGYAPSICDNHQHAKISDKLSQM